MSFVAGWPLVAARSISSTTVIELSLTFSESTFISSWERLRDGDGWLVSGIISLREGELCGSELNEDDDDPCSHSAFSGSFVTSCLI